MNAISLPTSVAIALLLAGALASQELPKSSVPIPESLPVPFDGKAAQDVATRCGVDYRGLATEHFDVISNDNVLFHKRYAGLIESFYRAFHELFGLKKHVYFTLYVSRTWETHCNLLDSMGHSNARGHTSPESFDGERTLFVSHVLKTGNNSGLGDIHPMIVRALLSANGKKRQKLPLWFTDGFSTLFELGRVVDGKLIYGNPNPIRDGDLVDGLEGNLLPAKGKWLKMKSDDWDRRRGLHVAAARSLFVFVRRKGEDRLQRLVNDIRKKPRGALRALLKATGEKKLTALDKAWRAQALPWAKAAVLLKKALTTPDIEARIATLEEALGLAPEYGLVRSELGRLLARHGDKKVAIESLHAALADPYYYRPYDAYSTLASTYWTDEVAKATAAARKAVFFEPWSLQFEEAPYRNLLSLLRRQELDDEARTVSELLDRRLAESSR